MRRVSLPRMLGRALTIVLALASLTVLPGPADSAGSTSITAKNGVRYDSCRSYPYTYTIKTAAGWPYWDAEITLYDPEGTQSDYDFLSDGDPTAGQRTVFICDFQPTGQWRLTIAVTHYDTDYNTTATETDRASFVLRMPQTRTTDTVNTVRPRRGQVVRFRITSKIERPAGFAPNRYANVAMEARRRGKWARIKGTLTSTGAAGVATVRVRKISRSPVAVRAVTLGTTVFAASVSPTKRIR